MLEAAGFWFSWSRLPVSRSANLQCKQTRPIYKYLGPTATCSHLRAALSSCPSGSPYKFCAPFSCSPVLHRASASHSAQFGHPSNIWWSRKKSWPYRNGEGSFPYANREGVWGSGNVTPPILNLGTRWKSVVTFTPRSLDPPGRISSAHWFGDREWHGAGVDIWRRDICWQCWEWSHDSSVF